MSRHIPDGKTYAPPNNRKCTRCGAYLSTKDMFTTTCEDFGYSEVKQNEKNSTNYNEYVPQVSGREEVVGDGKDKLSTSGSGQDTGTDGNSKEVSSDGSSKNSSSGRDRRRRKK